MQNHTVRGKTKFICEELLCLETGTLRFFLHIFLASASTCPTFVHTHSILHVSCSRVHITYTYSIKNISILR